MSETTLDVKDSGIDERLLEQCRTRRIFLDAVSTDDEFKAVWRREAVAAWKTLSSEARELRTLEKKYWPVAQLAVAAGACSIDPSDLEDDVELACMSSRKFLRAFLSAQLTDPDQNFATAVPREAGEQIRSCADFLDMHNRLIGAFDCCRKSCRADEIVELYLRNMHHRSELIEKLEDGDPDQFQSKFAALVDPAAGHPDCRALRLLAYLKHIGLSYVLLAAKEIEHERVELSKSWEYHYDSLKNIVKFARDALSQADKDPHLQLAMQAASLLPMTKTLVACIQRIDRIADRLKVRDTSENLRTLLPAPKDFAEEILDIGAVLEAALDETLTRPSLRPKTQSDLYSINCLLFLTDDANFPNHWVAHCMNNDIVAAGESPEIAEANLKAQLLSSGEMNSSNDLFDPSIRRFMAPARFLRTFDNYKSVTAEYKGWLKGFRAHICKIQTLPALRPSILSAPQTSKSASSLASSMSQESRSSDRSSSSLTEHGSVTPADKRMP